MRASHLALIVAVLALPSAAYSQDSGLVDGRVAPDLSTSSIQPSPSMGTAAYRRPPEPGSRAKMCPSSRDRTGAATPSSMAAP
jgi:hypothetical protein